MKHPPYNIIIADKDEKSKASLARYLRKQDWVGDINSAPSIKRAKHRLSTVLRCDAVFINSSLGIDDIVEFITEARQTENGFECAYIVVLTADETKEELVPHFARLGIAGFLLEPINNNSVKSMCDIIYRKQKQIAKAKLKQLDYKGPSKLLQRKFEELKEKE